MYIVSVDPQTTLPCMPCCRTLGEVVLNFPSFVEEVTMTADPESVRLKNYSEDEGEQ